MTTFTTIGGWATIAAVAGGLYYISSRNEKSRRPPITKQVQKAVEGTKGKAKKVKKAVLQSDGDSDVKSGSEKRKDTKSASSKAEPKQQSYAAAADDKEDEVDNHEFARQLEAAKTGKTFSQKSKTESRAKSVKQNKAHDKPVVEQVSDALTGSSTNGVDADDDQSPVQSPKVSASNGGGVADMLEKPGAGPSVLKISAPSQPAQTNNKKPKKEEVPAETKKARQNRQKAEAAKAQREADEVERQKLMEQQRRTARIAEGRAAKDGSSFQASKAAANNSWTAPLPTTNGTTPSNEKVQLLDTSEPSTNGASKAQGQGSNWNTSISEEEQIRLINENESWETVKNDKKTRQKKDAPKQTESSVVETARELAAPKKAEAAEPPITYAAAPIRNNNNIKKPVQQIEIEEDEWEVS